MWRSVCFGSVWAVEERSSVRMEHRTSAGIRYTKTQAHERIPHGKRLWCYQSRQRASHAHYPCSRPTRPVFTGLCWRAMNTGNVYQAPVLAGRVRGSRHLRTQTANTGVQNDVRVGDMYSRSVTTSRAYRVSARHTGLLRLSHTQKKVNFVTSIWRSHAKSFRLYGEGGGGFAPWPPDQGTYFHT